MKDYIRAVLAENKFKCRLKANFENIDEVDIDITLDTGCTHSHISADLIYVFLSDKEQLMTKKHWMRQRQFCLGYGIETANKNIDKSITISNPRIIIAHNFYNIVIDDVKIGNHKMYVSYDTCMTALIGMNFMKDWDMHIGTNKNKEVILLACPKNKITSSYLEALDNEFGIAELINSNRIQTKLI